jgi:hypothetical protein
MFHHERAVQVRSDKLTTDKVTNCQQNSNQHWGSFKVAWFWPGSVIKYHTVEYYYAVESDSLTSRGNFVRSVNLQNKLYLQYVYHVIIYTAQ